MAKREFKIGDIVMIDSFMFQDIVGEIININSDIDRILTRDLFKYEVKFEDSSICDFNENEMFHCDKINIFENELSFVELVNRANDIEFNETWMIKGTDSTIKLNSDGGYLDFENCRNKISNNDKFILVHIEKPMSFQEAFKHYLKGNTIKPYYNKDIEFNINPNSMQECIDNVHECEIDEEWIIKG